MASIDARKEEYEHVELFGKPALFTDSRISRFTVPQGWFCYDLRGSDSDPGEPITVEKFVGVNHAGTILAPEELPFKKGKDYVPIKDGLNFLGEKVTLEEFCAEQGLEYPALIDRSLYDAAMARKPAYTKSEETGRVKAIREMSRCGCCGGRIRMSAGREGWTRWNCADCGALGAKATTENIVPQVEAILTSLIRGELAIVEPPHKEPQTSALIQKESNFAAMLEVEDFDESAAMTAAMELAAARYDCIGAEDYETMRIRHRIGQTVGNTNFNIDLLRDIGPEIQIQPSGEVDITLKNGQTTGRNGDP